MAPECVTQRDDLNNWYGGYDAAAAATPGTLEYRAAQRLKLFPLGSRVRIVGYEGMLAGAAALNFREGTVLRAQFGGVYVRLDKRGRERSEKVELVTWPDDGTPRLELLSPATAHVLNYPLGDCT